jgi:hypothetical protein
MIIEQLPIVYPSVWHDKEPLEKLWESLLDHEEVAVIDASGYFKGLLLPEVVELDSYTEMPKSASAILDDIISVPVVREQDHIFNAAKILPHATNGLIGVITDDNSFKGYLKADRVKDIIINGLNLSLETGVLLVELSAANLSISQMVQLIEQEGIKIMGLTVHRPVTEDLPFMVSIKVNSPDTIRATASLRRFEYVVHDFSSGVSMTDEMRSRVDELMHYLSI